MSASGHSQTAPGKPCAVPEGPGPWAWPWHSQSGRSGGPQWPWRRQDHTCPRQPSWRGWKKRLSQEHGGWPSGLCRRRFDLLGARGWSWESSKRAQKTQWWSRLRRVNIPMGSYTSLSLLRIAAPGKPCAVPEGPGPWAWSLVWGGGRALLCCSRLELPKWSVNLTLLNIDGCGVKIADVCLCKTPCELGEPHP